jgi:hypothetical protein
LAISVLLHFLEVLFIKLFVRSSGSTENVRDKVKHVYAFFNDFFAIGIWLIVLPRLP